LLLGTHDTQSSQSPSIIASAVNVLAVGDF